MLDDDIVALVLERNVDLLQEEVRRLADNHGRHELSSDPCGTSIVRSKHTPQRRQAPQSQDVQAPPPGATAASRIVILRSGRSLASE